MPYCTEYCIDMPETFPALEFSAFRSTARTVLLKQGDSPLWAEFAGASNLTGWRFRACCEDWHSYKLSLSTLGSHVPHEELYRRQNWLFGMFSAGVSSVESTSYALAALLSHSSVLAITFDAKRQRSCSLQKLFDWLPKTAPKQLTEALAMVLGASEWKLWREFRNRMTHCSNLPDKVVGAIGSAPPTTAPIDFGATSSSREFSARPDELDALVLWLGYSLRSMLLAGTAAVVASQAP